MLIKNGREKDAERLGAGKCIGCGACSYICPSYIKLSGVVADFAALKRRKGSYPYSAVGDSEWIDDLSLLSADPVSSAESRKPVSDTITLPFEGWETE